MSRLAVPRKWQRPPQPAGEDARRFAAAVLSAALQQASANQRGALESSDPDYVHQLRVGLRRYRSALRLFRGLMRRKERRRLDRRARGAMAPLGAVRDWDVCLAWLKAAGAPKGLRRRGRLIREALRRSLTAADLAPLAPAEAAWKKKQMPFVDFRQRALRKARRRVAKRIDELDWRDAGQRHRLRIAVKQWRYAADFLGAGTGSLRRLQDSLGKLSDLAVIRRLLAELAAPPALERRLAAAERRLVALAGKQVGALELKD